MKQVKDDLNALYYNLSFKKFFSNRRQIIIQHIQRELKNVLKNILN
jgi:hypothetical protein